MAQVTNPPNFTDCLTIGEAARFLGVSPATLRNWDRSGKLKPRRHPHNGYRIYLHEDLAAVLQSAALTADPATGSKVEWSAISDTDHFVQFYESDAYLIESVSTFVHAALTHGNASIAIATPEHRQALQRALVSMGIDVADAIETGRYVVLDAADMLAKFMTGGMPDAKRFDDTIGSLLAQLAEGGRRVHAFGEMVALLWKDENIEAAIRLEELWNELGKSCRFALFCAYPIAEFDQEEHAAAFSGICGCHTRVIPAESYHAIDNAEERLRAISSLQQQAQSLEAEIAHRRQVEDALRKRERELADFFDNATEGLHKVGPDSTILWANKAECDLLGYSEQEYVGRSITEFHADEAVIADMLEKLKNGETLVDYPARLRCKDGTIKHVLISSNACFEDGEFAYTRCFTRDVTRQWEAEQTLREADRRKDTFLATLAHELRNPLAPIRNSLEILVASTQGPDGNMACDVIKRQVEQMSRLVDDLLDVSRISHDRIELRKVRVELADVIRGAVETSQHAIESASHRLTVSLPPEPLYLQADPTRMAQVFSNLLQNAAKYTEPGGNIDIQAERRDSNLIVRVRDNGIGISCEDLAHVFDMFRQVDGSLERAQGGLGIGLTLVRRLVEMHGGTVNAQSAGPGKGSEFVVQLPVDAAHHQQPTEATQAAAAFSKKRILVVDDNKDSADTLSMLLRLKGHEVRTARDGFEAIDAVTEFHPKVILMDVGMPKMNGYEATRRIRQLPYGKDTMIVALTGWGQTDDVQRSAEAGCSAHLVKPVDIAVLERLLAGGGSPAG